MRKLFFLALPLASLMLCMGCNEADSYSSSGFTSPTSTATATASTPTPAPTPTYSRSTTTQPLPSGWGYLHEADLTGGRLVNSGQPARPAPTTVSSASNGG